MKRLLKKLLAVSLCAALVGGTAVSLPAVVPDGGITATASDFSGEYKLYKYFTYVVVDDHVEIVNYLGSEEVVSIPSEIDGKSVTAIWSSAFMNCSSLTSITIPDGITSIGYKAFYGCNSLRSITIPDSLINVGDFAFTGCEGLADSNGFVVVKNVLYAYLGKNTSVTIPDNVTRIEDGVFKDKGDIKSITIPKGITIIGDNAFSGCRSLTSIIIPKSVTKIGNGAFQSCESLTSINIPDSVISIGHFAFNLCSNLTSVTIPTSVMSIGDDAFSRCEGLADDKGFVIVRNVLYGYYGNDANITIPSSVTTIGSSAFSGCSSIKSVTIPSGVTSLGFLSFSDCSNLTNITIPDSVISMGGHTFDGCISLLSVTIPSNIKSIGDSVFFDCSSLKSVTIPEGVKSIGSSAFYDCRSLNSITIPNSVTSIGDWAFIGCLSLKSITIPSCVTSIGEDAFGYNWNTDTYEYEKIEGFTIYGKSGSAAEKYAKNHVFKFVSTTADTELKNSSAISATTVTAGTEVTMTGKGTGGTSPYKYAYYYKKSTDSTWTKAYVTSSGSAYTKYDSVKFTPTTAGTYNVRINVKDKYGEGTVVSKDFKLTVKDAALTNNSTVSATTVTAGTEVTMTGKATGGTSPYKYAYYYKKSTDSTWTKAYVTSSGSAYTKYDSVKFTPTTVGTYNVRINVKDKYGEGTVVSKDFKLTVKDAALTNNSTVSATTVTAGTEVTMTGKAAGGTSPYKYAYYYKKSTDSAWTKAYVTSSGSAYTKYDSMKFTPTTAGTYNVRINVKDKYGEGTAVSKDFKITVK